MQSGAATNNQGDKERCAACLQQSHGVRQGDKSVSGREWGEANERGEDLADDAG